MERRLQLQLRSIVNSKIIDGFDIIDRYKNNDGITMSRGCITIIVKMLGRKIIIQDDKREHKQNKEIFA